MSDTPERRRLIDFTVPYYKAPVRFVGAGRASPLDDTPEALAGKMVGVQRGTINQTFMAAHYPADAAASSTATRSTCCST